MNGKDKCLQKVTEIITKDGIDDLLYDSQNHDLLARAGRWKIDLSKIAAELSQTASSKSEYDIGKFREMVVEHGISVFDRQFYIEKGLGLKYTRAASSDRSWREIAEICEVLGDYDQMVKDKKDAPRKRLLQDAKKIFDEFGVSIFFGKFYHDNPEHKSIKSRFPQHDLNFPKLAEYFDVSEEFRAAAKIYRRQAGEKGTETRGQEVWTQERLDKVVADLIERYNGIPPIDFVEHTAGIGGFSRGIYLLGYTMDSLRDKYNVPVPERMRDMEGKIFKSYPESAMSNWLLARGISTEVGKRYPDDFGAFTEGVRKSAYYDLHFQAADGRYMNVEVRGGGMNHAKKENLEGYNRVSDLKKAYHEDRDDFIEIGFADCYDDAKLAEIMKPFIGELPVIKTPNDYERIPPTKWSLLDEVLRMARDICEKVKGPLPPVAWFRRNRAYEDRTKLEWELDSYEGFIDNIFQVGGFGVLRQLLGEPAKVRQSDLHKNQEKPKKTIDEIRWTKQDVEKEFRAVKDHFGKSPYAAFSMLYRKQNRTKDEQSWMRRTYNMLPQARKLFDGGHREVCQLVGIPIK